MIFNYLYQKLQFIIFQSALVFAFFYHGTIGIFFNSNHTSYEEDISSTI